MESPIVQEYLEAIFKLLEDAKGLGTTELGRELGVSPASASQMTDRLARKGLVEKSREKGIALTPKGREAALDVLGMDWKEVHEEACKLEHVISPEVETRMEAMLDNAGTCPHGHPIPDRLGHTAEQQMRKLSSLKRSQTGIIAKISEERRELLEYLATLGMMPECPVSVEQVAPFDGPLLIRVKGASYALGREIAEKIWVREK